LKIVHGFVSMLENGSISDPRLREQGKPVGKISDDVEISPGFELKFVVVSGGPQVEIILIFRIKSGRAGQRNRGIPDPDLPSLFRAKPFTVPAQFHRARVESAGAFNLFFLKNKWDLSRVLFLKERSRWGGIDH